MDPKSLSHVTQEMNGQPANSQPPPVQPVFPDSFYRTFRSYQPLGYMPLPYDPNMLQPSPMMFPGTSHTMPFMLPPANPLPMPDAQPQSAPQAPPISEESKNATQGKKEKPKETPKEDFQGRLYKCCKCDKSYLSYPALYTHTKLKHLQPGESPSITNGRMRGRPRKNIVSSL